MKIYTENFTIILNKHIINKDIDTYEFRVLCYLLLLADDEGTCYPSYKTIAERIGISETKAKAAVNKLISLGIIKKEKRKKANGSASSNLYVVCEKTTVRLSEVAENTTPCISDDLPGGVQEDIGGASDDYNKYPYINNNYFTNNHLLSIEDVKDRAETYNLYDETRKQFEAALEIMYNSKSILIDNQKIPYDIVHKRLENISYYHIVYVCNRLDAKREFEITNPISYIIKVLYNALLYTEDEIKSID